MFDCHTLPAEIYAELGTALHWWMHLCSATVLGNADMIADDTGQSRMIQVNRVSIAAGRPTNHDLLQFSLQRCFLLLFGGAGQWQIGLCPTLCPTLSLAGQLGLLPANQIPVYARKCTSSTSRCQRLCALRVLPMNTGSSCLSNHMQPKALGPLNGGQQRSKGMGIPKHPVMPLDFEESLFSWESLYL